MKILVTNDDGIQAAGIRALLALASELGAPVVVAPSQAASGCSHQTTTDRRLTVQQVADNEWSVDGTPADCVRLGLTHLVPDAQWVLSGINHGGNLGVDLFLSGTVAAAREAALLGRPAVALSQYRRRREPADWDHAKGLARGVLPDLVRPSEHVPGFWNVNFPDADDRSYAPSVVHCEPDLNPLPMNYAEESGQFRYAGDYHGRQRQPGTDVDVCFSGNIAVSRIQLRAH